MKRTELGFIQKVSFGWGGYDDCMLGLSVTLGGKSWGVDNFKGTWGTDRTEHTKWTEEDRIKILAETCMFVKRLLTSARKKDVADLVGVPIEATFEDNKLESWRVLEEVLP